MATKIKIDKGIPVSEVTAGRPSRFPTGEMEVGDSYFVPGYTTPRMSGHLHYWKTKHGWRFKTCRRTENRVSGVRVWRIA